jgi:ankyrin repeat protein
MWAINGGNKNVMRYIIDLPGVDINARDGSGQTALNWVSFSGRLSDADRAELTALLKAKGAQ